MGMGAGIPTGYPCSALAVSISQNTMHLLPMLYGGWIHRLTHMYRIHIILSEHLTLRPVVGQGITLNIILSLRSRGLALAAATI